jgi:hypothetical protein
VAHLVDLKTITPDLYPTPTRVRLLAEAAGPDRLARYPDGLDYLVQSGRIVTSRVAEQVQGGWLKLLPRGEGRQYRPFEDYAPTVLGWKVLIITCQVMVEAINQHAHGITDAEIAEVLTWHAETFAQTTGI